MSKVIFCKSIFSSLPVYVLYDTSGYDDSQPVYIRSSHCELEAGPTSLFKFHVFRICSLTIITLDLPSSRSHFLERHRFASWQYLNRMLTLSFYIQ